MLKVLFGQIEWTWETTSTSMAELGVRAQEDTVEFDDDGPVDFAVEDEDLQKPSEAALEPSLELHNARFFPRCGPSAS